MILWGEHAQSRELTHPHETLATPVTLLLTWMLTWAWEWGPRSRWHLFRIPPPPAAMLKIPRHPPKLAATRTPQ